MLGLISNDTIASMLLSSSDEGDELNKYSIGKDIKSIEVRLRKPTFLLVIEIFFLFLAIYEALFFF